MSINYFIRIFTFTVLFSFRFEYCLCQSYHVGRGPISLINDDFNGDGRVDLATANRIDRNVSVLLNGGFSMTDRQERIFEIQPGPGDGKDTYLVEHSTESERNFGSGAGLFVVGEDTPTIVTRRRSIIEFDINRIPDDASILHADVRLFCYVNNNPMKIGIYRLCSKWDEGTGVEATGIDSASDGASWKFSKVNQTWTISGGDYSSLLSSASVSGIGWYSWDLSAEILAMQKNSEENHGFILKNIDETEGSGSIFYSSDSERAQLRPILRIVYTIPVTTGTIQGKVTDSNTNSAIPGAVITTNTGLQVETDTFGNFRIPRVIPGSGYTVTAIKNGYAPTTSAGLQVLVGKVTTTNISLGLTDVTNLIAELYVPGAEESTVMMLGTTGYRYIRVFHGITHAPAVDVAVKVKVGTHETISRTDMQGIAKIAIPTNFLENGVGSYSAMVTEISGIAVPAIDQLHFVIKAQYMEYMIEWDCSTFGDLSVSFADLGLKNGFTLGLREDNQSGLPQDFDQMAISRHSEAALGASLDPGVGANFGIDIHDISVGTAVGYEAGVHGSAVGSFEDSYLFPMQVGGFQDAIARSIVVLDGALGILSPDLVALVSYLESTFTGQSVLDSALTEAQKGFGVTGGGSVNAHARVGFFGEDYTFGLSANSNLGVEGSALRTYISRPKNSESAVDACIRGLIGADLSAGLEFGDQPFNANRGTYDASMLFGLFLNASGGREWDHSFECAFNSDKELTRITLRVRIGSGIGSVTQRDQYEYEVTSGKPGSLESVVNHFSILRTALRSVYTTVFEGGTVVLDGRSSSAVLYGFFDAVGQLQGQGKDLRVTFSHSRNNEVPLSSVNVVLQGNLTSALKGKVGVGGSLTENNPYLIDAGIWVQGKHWILMTSSKTQFPTSSHTLSEVLQGIISDVGTSTIDALFSNIRRVVEYGKSEIINVGNGVISFAENAFQSSKEITVATWTWMADGGTVSSPSKSSKGYLIRSRIKGISEQLAGFRYGIGGFYRLEPYGLTIDGSASITIKYEEAELEGLENDGIAAYIYNLSTGQWDYVGGEVNVTSHELRTSIRTLGIYTIGSIVPTGDFRLVPIDSELPADGSSRTTLQSSILVKSDGNPVENGTLYTITISLGTILSTDVDSDVEGVQVSADSGKISVEIQSASVGGTSQIVASSYMGNSRGSGSVNFKDLSAPIAPVLRFLTTIGAGQVLATWDPSPSIDVTCYSVHYNGDTNGPPYNGLATIEGLPSPVVVGEGTTCVLAGLQNGMTYFVAIVAHDNSGNSSPYSNELSVSAQLLEPTQTPTSSPSATSTQTETNTPLHTFTPTSTIPPPTLSSTPTPSVIETPTSTKTVTSSEPSSSVENWESVVK